MSSRRSPEASTADPTPTPSPIPEELAGVLEWRPESETNSPLFGPTPSPSPFLPPSFSPEASSPSPEPDAGPDSADPSTGDGPEAPRIARSARQRARDLLPSTRAAVTTAGGVAHAFLTVEGTPENEAGLYLPDEEDVEAIAGPLAGLASRRVPAEATNPDVSDLIGLALGVVGYVMKQVRKRAGLRRMADAGINVAPEQDDDGTDWSRE